MSNKLPWLKHLSNARMDGWLRHLVRNQGYEAGWVWWCLLEIMQTHGSGDTLKRNINDISDECMVSTRVLKRILTEMGNSFDQTIRVRYSITGETLLIEIKKFRELQHNLRLKIVPKPYQNRTKTVIDIEGEGEGEGETPYSPSFDQFWARYPKRTAKAVAIKSWNKLKLDEPLFIAIMTALDNHKKNPDWGKENGKFIPHASTWLNQRRWEDEVAVETAYGGSLPGICKNCGVCHYGRKDCPELELVKPGRPPVYEPW